MNVAQAHRGPDDEGQYVDPAGRVAIGARRLSIIDVANGHQPLANEDESVWAVLNGEIYNSPMLRERLIRSGHQFRSRCDTETVVHLYEEFGHDLVHALEGMYAFAVWDQGRGCLLLGRDRFGEKPLFVETGNGGLRFASELSALLAARRQQPELDLAALDKFFVLGYLPGPHTAFHGIEQIPPGHTFLWDHASKQSVLRRYWVPRRSARAEPESVAELVGETDRLLRRAVRQTLVSDRPVGVFLSGGVDSALVTAMVRRESTATTPSFTVGYDVGDVSEFSEARRTAAQLGTEHHELVLTECEVTDRVPRVLAALDQPLADPAVIPLHAVAELAKRQVAVVVGGEGADELFGGYPRYRWLIRSNQIRQVMPDLAARAAANALAGFAPGSAIGRIADLFNPQATLDRHLDWVTAQRRWHREEVYGPRLSPLSRSTAAATSLRPHIDELTSDRGADTFMQLDQRHWLPDDVLFKVDRAGMLNGLEIRTPYLSRELAEFANSVRASVHLAGSGKALLRAVLATYIPRDTSDRRKTAFRVPGAEWLRGDLRPLLEEQARSGILAEAGYVDTAALTRLTDEHARGHDRTALLWPILALGLWLDAHLGGP